jgi:hypothetical protein
MYTASGIYIGPGADGGGKKGGGKGAKGGKADLPDGDWRCSGCGNHNYKFRDSCNKCGTKRDDPSGSRGMDGGSSQSMQARGGGNPQQYYSMPQQQQYFDPYAMQAQMQAQQALEAQAFQAPQPMWMEAQDPSTGGTYYYNTVTRETRWDDPNAPVPQISVQDAAREFAEKKRKALALQPDIQTTTVAGSIATAPVSSPAPAPVPGPAILINDSTPAECEVAIVPTRWKCARCNSLNKNKRTSCHSCFAPKLQSNDATEPAKNETSADIEIEELVQSHHKPTKNNDAADIEVDKPAESSTSADVDKPTANGTGNTEGEKISFKMQAGASKRARTDTDGPAHGFGDDTE